jgi:hypothetical protein
MNNQSHFNTGNEYAKKNEPSTAYLQVRCTHQKKDKWKKKADALNMSLSELTICLLDKVTEGEISL